MSDLAILLGFTFLWWLLPTMAMGHLEYSWNQRNEYPERPGEPGIRYVLRAAGIMLYNGAGIWKDFAVGGAKRIASTTRWLIVGKDGDADAQ